ncbi:MAG TPA: CRTAC1 family protein [Vicinamibacteria bacterium]
MLPALALVCLCAAAVARPAGTPPAGHARLVELRREAAERLEHASRAGIPVEEGLRQVRDAAARLDELASGAGAASLGAPLREALARAAAELRALRAPEGAWRFDAAPFLAVLARVQREPPGDAALGLDFQGSYSQTRPREPVYGGHASAMGPAPVDPPAPREPARPAAPSPVQFEETARLPTRTYCGGPTKDHILESAGNGVALFDYDGDGRLDVYLVTAAELTRTRERVPHRNALYRNLGGWRFEDVSARAGVDAAAWGSGACAGDADGDGRLDLYVTNWGPNLLFRNRGDGTFAETAAAAGVAAGGWSTGCSFFDADADGDLDLYVARYVEATWADVQRAQRTLVWRSGPRIMVGPSGLPGESDLFFENVGSGRFVDATRARGLEDPGRAYGFGVVTTDVDADGFVDVFVANDSNPNFLHRNLGGRFESVGLLGGVGVNAEGRAQAGMGADAGDYDGDLRMDIVLTAFAHDNNTLFRNVDGRRFEDVSVPAGLAAPTFERMGWGTALFDADLDGRLDLFFANGHIFADVDEYPQLRETYRQKSQLLLGDGARFRDVSATAGPGLQVARVGRGLAVGDLDDDGDLDLVVSNMDDVPSVLENRLRAPRRWVAFRVVSPAGNRFAIGARVTMTAGGRAQVREIRSGGSYLSQGDLRAHFGLGDERGPVAVEVRMPGGASWRWTDLAGDRVHVLTLDDAHAVTRAGGTR